MKPNKFWYVFFIIISLFFLLIGFNKRLILNQRHSFTYVTILEIEQCGAYNCFTYSYTADGKIITKETWTKSTPNLECFKTWDCKGRKYKVKYDPENPENHLVYWDEEIEE